MPSSHLILCQMYSIMNWHCIHYEMINTVSLKGKPLYRTSYMIFKHPVWNENVWSLLKRQESNVIKGTKYRAFSSLSGFVSTGHGYIFYLLCIYACVHVKLLQSCLTLCNPMDCNLPGSSVHGILQARIQEWVATSFSRGSSQSKDWTRVSRVSCIGRPVLYH